MKRHIGILIILLGLLGAGAAVVVGLSRPRPAPAAPPEQKVEQPAADELIRGDLEIQGATLSKHDAQGNLVWSLEAETQIAFNAERKTAEARNVNWRLQSQGISWVVEAPHLVIDYETGQLEFTRGVQLYSTDESQRFSVTQLVYQPDSRKLIGEGPVEFRRGAATVTGGRLVVDNRARQVRLTGGVRCRVGSG